MLDAYEQLGKVAWTHLAWVVVKGEPGVEPLTGAVADDETATKIVAGWQKIAVLKVTPAGAKFYVGFQTIDGSTMQLMPNPVEAKSGLFGLRIGDSDVRYFAVPVDPNLKLQLELHARVSIDNSTYADLPLY